MDLISIIITTYNRTQWLNQALKSAVEQTYHPVEVIVVDDGSDNRDVKTIAEKYSQVQYIYQKNQGLGAARNLGIACSKGKWIQFLDDDDWLSMDAIQAKLSLFVSRPDLGVVYSDLYLTDENGIVCSRCFEHITRPLPSGDIYPILVERNFIPVHSLLWKRQVLEEVGGFPNRSGLEDWECLVRAAEFSTFSALDIPLGYYRIHEQSMSHDLDSMYQSKLSFQTYISGSKRFDGLPSIQRNRLLTKFAFQQWAFGDPQKAHHYLDLARQDERSALLPSLLRFFMLFGQPIAKWLVKARGLIWEKIGH
jgi:glycosyltransferase involved in cell wall biosynthesis